MPNEAKQNKEMGDIVGAGTITAEVVVEREFGNGSFLEMYSGYVSKAIPHKPLKNNKKNGII